jgi:4-diphosphocytidyl-2-C-methyl-D-erythritol kinase
LVGDVPGVAGNRSVSTQGQCRLQTPAKLNLGLEILGKRSDGYHELRTIFQAVTIFDSLSFAPAPVFEYISDAGIDPCADIARPILTSAAADHDWTGRLSQHKGIPVAAGLGGGSSDAALALRLASGGREADRDAARTLGADVPFFLRGGTAIGAGIGDELRSIITPTCWFVVNVPLVEIPDKTKTLYRGLSAADVTSGEMVERIAAQMMATGSDNLPEAFPNGFERQMLLLDEVQRAWTVLKGLTGRSALSGAGPAVYSWHNDKAEAADTYLQVDATLPGESFLCRSLPPHDNDCAIEQFSNLLNG